MVNTGCDIHLLLSPQPNWTGANSSSSTVAVGTTYVPTDRQTPTYGVVDGTTAVRLRLPEVAVLVELGVILVDADGMSLT